MRWVLSVVGAAVVLGSLFGLTFPLSLQVVDRSGVPIACGTGFRPAHHRAAHEDAVNQDLHNSFGAPYDLSDYTAQCDAMVTTRRGISLSVMVFGGAMLGTAVLLLVGAPGYVKALATRSRRTPLKKRTNQLLPPKASPPPVRYCDDLSRVLGSIGLRVQR